MRIGILGGSFDPIHYGHLLLAENCRENCRLDQVWLVPAAVSPHKTDRRPADAKTRMKMIRLAIGGHSGLDASSIEIDRGGVSFTVETLEDVQSQQPTAELFFLMGADTLAEFPEWHRPDDICRLATPVVVRRFGADEPDLDILSPLTDPKRLAEIRACQTDMPRIEISSSDIRERVAQQRSIRFQTPRSVEKYIETHGLYRFTNPSTPP